ncbi:MAG: hypothetical protein JWM76_4103 [Pseudonocardiales bacterium]|nr:hypothetical protein [Pseudonocardiales bacterium]
MGLGYQDMTIPIRQKPTRTGQKGPSCAQPPVAKVWLTVGSPFPKGA